MKKIAFIFLCLLPILLLSCIQSSDSIPINCSERPALTDVAQALSSCLEQNVSENDVIELLEAWKYEGNALSADMIQASLSEELVVTYEAEEGDYGPQGKIAVLEYSRRNWHVIFESPDPKQNPPDGNITLEGSWSFKLDQIVDMGDDGIQEMLFTQSRSLSPLNKTITIYKLLVAESGAIKPLLVEGDTQDANVLYFPVTFSIEGPYLKTTKSDRGVNIVRTLSLENGQIVEEKVEEFADHNLAKLSVELPDGTIYFSFDDDACTSSNSHTLKSGLYRLKDGDVFHYGDGRYICHIEILSDGNLYASGAGVWKVEADSLIPIQNQYAPLLIEDKEAYGLTAITDIAMNSKGELWAKNLHGLFFYGHQQSEWFLMGHGEKENRFRENLLLDPGTNRGPLVIGPDDSLWVLGWDGYAERRCCIFRFQNSDLTVFQRDDELPISAELRGQIFADE